MINLINDVTKAKETTSGLAILIRIRASKNFATSGAADAHADKIGERAYYRTDMSEAEIIEATNTLEADLDLAPAEMRAGKHYMQNKMISKFKVLSPLCVTKADELKAKIFDGEIVGTTPFTPRQLSSIMAGHLATLPAANNVFVAGQRGGNGGDRPFSFVKKCVTCGATGHVHAECNKKCPKCGLDICQGARGLECVVNAAEPPKDLKNALGRPLPAHLEEKLVRIWHEKHPNGIVCAALLAGAADESDEEVDVTSE